MMERAKALGADARVWAAAIGLLGVLGALAVLSATRLGPGLGSDSAVYIAGAQSLAAGEGLRWDMGGNESRPSTHPPLYSAALVPFEVLGIGWEAGARILGALLLGATIVGVGNAARRMTASAVAGFLAALVVLTTPDIFGSYAWAMTEGLYLALTSLLILLALEYRRAPSWTGVASLALTSCLLYLTKFGGFSVIPAMAVVMLATRGISRPTRWKHLGLLAGITALPFLAWGWVNTANTGTVLRPLAVNSIEGSQVRSGLAVLIAWMLPQDRLPEALNPVRTIYLLAMVVIAAALAAGVLILALRRAHRSNVPAKGIEGSWIIPAALGVCYLAIHTFSVLFTRPQPDTSARTLLPIYLPLVLLGCWAAALAWRTSRAWVRAALVILAFFFLQGRLAESISRVGVLAKEGAGYTAWKNAGVIAALRSLPGELVYTDDEGPVFLLAGRPARSIPFKWGPEGDLRDSYPEEIARMRANLKAGAILVLFDPAPRMRELPDYDELTACLNEVYGDFLGRIYVWPDRGGSGTCRD